MRRREQCLDPTWQAPTGTLCFKCFQVPVAGVVNSLSPPPPPPKMQNNETFQSTKLRRSHRPSSRVPRRLPGRRLSLTRSSPERPRRQKKICRHTPSATCLERDVAITCPCSRREDKKVTLGSFNSRTIESCDWRGEGGSCSADSFLFVLASGADWKLLRCCTA